MKSPLLLAMLLACPLLQAEAPKTNSSLPIAPGLLPTPPYSLTGLVLTSEGRGSGFVAADRKLFFSAAHVVRGDSAWGAAPAWYAGVNGAAIPASDTAVMARGYFRWDSYAEERALNGENSKQAFAQDVILAWGNTDFVAATPAAIDYSAEERLTDGQPCMITGYPAIIDYTDASGGYFQHATAFQAEFFKEDRVHYLITSLISTGPGNSGGPVWTQGPNGAWLASAVLVSGRPSETGIYALNKSVKKLLECAAPAIHNPRLASDLAKGISATTYFWQTTKTKKIPDGATKYTSISLKLKGYPEGAKVSSLVLNLNISTTHVGDLVVGLQSPDGVFTMLHNGEGATDDNLVLTNKDLIADFSGAMANGKWQLLVQDRLKGDLTTVNSFQLEVGTD